MNRMTTSLAVAALSASLLSACGGSDDTSSVASDCTPAHKFSTVKSGTLSVAITEAAPFSSYADKKATGTDAAIIEAIAKVECLDVDYTPMSYAAAVPAVQTGRADLAIGGFYRSESRAEIVSLSDPLYLDKMAIISKGGETSLSSLEGQKVGTIDGYVWVADFQKIFGDDLTLYPSITEMRADLEAGRIDAGVEGYAVSSLLMKDTDYSVELLEPDDRVGATTNPAQTGFPIAKEATALLEAVNADLAEMHADGSLADLIVENGLDASAADTGEPRLLS